MHVPEIGDFIYFKISQRATHGINCPDYSQSIIKVGQWKTDK